MVIAASNASYVILSNFTRYVVSFLHQQDQVSLKQSILFQLVHIEQLANSYPVCVYCPLVYDQVCSMLVCLFVCLLVCFAGFTKNSLYFL